MNKYWKISLFVITSFDYSTNRAQIVDLLEDNPTVYDVITDMTVKLGAGYRIAIPIDPSKIKDGIQIVDVCEGPLYLQGMTKEKLEEIRDILILHPKYRVEKVNRLNRLKKYLEKIYESESAAI